MNIGVKKLDIKKDHRGWLAEIVQPKDVGSNTFGLILVTTAKPGQTKGNHYHKIKTEWYCVIRGQALLTLIDNKTQEVKKLHMGEDNMVLVRIPPNNFHTIKNVGGKEMYLMVYVNQAFDPKDPDTYYDKPL